MKAPSAIINSSVGFALFAAGCACDKQPAAVQASNSKAVVQRQAAAQQFQQAVPLQTPTFPNAARPLPRPPQLEGPGTPQAEYVRDTSLENGAVAVAQPPEQTAVPTLAPQAQAQPKQMNRPVNRKALPGAWNSVSKGGKGGAPAGKSSKISSASGAMSIS